LNPYNFLAQHVGRERYGGLTVVATWLHDGILASMFGEVSAMGDAHLADSDMLQIASAAVKAAAPLSPSSSILSRAVGRGSAVHLLSLELLEPIPARIGSTIVCLQTVVMDDGRLEICVADQSGQKTTYARAVVAEPDSWTAQFPAAGAGTAADLEQVLQDHELVKHRTTSGCAMAVQATVSLDAMQYQLQYEVPSQPSSTYATLPPALDWSLAAIGRYLLGAPTSHSISDVTIATDRRAETEGATVALVVDLRILSCSGEKAVVDVRVAKAAGTELLRVRAAEICVNSALQASVLSHQWVVEATSARSHTVAFDSCLYLAFEPPVSAVATSVAQIAARTTHALLPTQFEVPLAWAGSSPSVIVCNLINFDIFASIVHDPLGWWVQLLEKMCACTRHVVVLTSSCPDTVNTLDYGSALRGALLTAQAEYPRVVMKSVQVDGNVAVLEECVTQALAELARDEFEVAYENNQRLVKRYSPLSMAAAAQPPSIPAGAVVITGGLGGLGLTTAKYLTEVGATDVVLVSRSGRVSNSEQGLEAMLNGLMLDSKTAVHVLACDVADEADLTRLLDTVRSTVGPIVGVIHAAGVIRDGLIRGGAAVEGSNAVWASKAHSGGLLHKHTQHDALSVFITFSSVTAALGAPGQSAYGAANRFLDSLMSMRQQLGLPGTSIQWPAVSDVGMAVSIVNKLDSQLKKERWSIDSRAVRKVLGSVLSGTTVPGAVLTIMPPDLFSELQPAIAAQFAAVATAPESVQSSTVSNAAPADMQHTAEEIALVVRQVIRTVLPEITASPEDAQLMDIGLDSLGVTELANKLSTAMKVKVPPTLVFSYPSTKDIIEYFQTAFGVGKASKVTAAGPAPSALAAVNEVAVVGMSCRFPGDINSTRALWSTLLAGENKTSEVSLNRWDTDSIIAMMDGVDSDIVDRIRYGGFLSDEVLATFDASFFRISEAEASRMDPAQRLLLTVSYEALVDAGYTKETIRGMKVGVFVGASGNIGEVESMKSSLAAHHKPSVYDATGGTLSVAAGRISYVLELEGPSMTIDTACSSSLVALHTARRSLQHGECDIAIVASEGVLTAASSVACAVAGMTSVDGKCHTFNESAKGYGRGEGAGAVVLKRMQTAVHDDSEVYAVICGSAVAQDGKSASLTAPNGLAQAQLLRSALQDADLDIGDISMVEAHGTGTKLGDPVETAALADVYGELPKGNEIYVSSVKANIGHLEAAAGMAGLFSAILSLMHGTAPPNAQLQTLNEQVEQSVADKRLVFPTVPTPLHRRGDRPLTAGLSSFGYSGTIAHVVLREPDSAICKRKSLEQPAAKQSTIHTVSGMVWQFSGQGTLVVNACKDMYDTEPEYRRAIHRCDEILQGELRTSIVALLYPASDSSGEEAAAALNDTHIAQPVLVALQYSLTQVWLARGVTPEMVLGHSLGEYAAAVVAGVMTLENCLRLVSARARVMQKHSGGHGVMAAARLSSQAAEEAIQRLNLQELVAVAAVNGAKSIVVSGTDEAVRRVLEATGSANSSRKLNVKHAFHSPLMRGMLEQYRQVLETVNLRVPTVRWVSTVGNTTAAVNTVQYWLDHVVRSVQLVSAVQEAMRMQGTLFVEFGADSTLSRLSQAIGFDLDRNKTERTFILAGDLVK
jgi:3-oxoacyl-(acyl-carrier-protein) synthase/malonyl CoA-acyl carrier protein transacylase/NAD(P)-dependent dehydrogenase (short-subunit alcohol dehydrogenase family)/acyl carrier protein